MAEKLFYSMGEVAELFDVNQSLLRHWESQFSILRPQRNKKGNRLFSAQDVENLKVIYHLVKERGMTLEGAKKALRQHKSDRGVQRDTQLMERLQRIRSLLVEVREDLKEGGKDLTGDSSIASQLAEGDASAKPRRGRKAVVKIDEQSVGTGDSESPKTPKKPRRKKTEAESKELFAFYEQSLF